MIIDVDNPQGPNNNGHQLTTAVDKTNIKTDQNLLNAEERNRNAPPKFILHSQGERIQTDQKQDSNEDGEEIQLKHFFPEEMRIEAEYKRLEKEKAKWKALKSHRRRRDNFLFILFTGLYITIILMQFDIPYRYQVVETLNNFFDFETKRTNKVNSNYYIDFLGEFFELHKEDYWIIDKKFELAGSFRVTRRLFKILEDVENPVVKNSPYKMKGGGLHRFSPFNPDIEESRDVDFAELSTPGESFPFSYSFNQSYLNLGGYVYTFRKTQMIDMDDPDYPFNQTKIERIRKELFEYFYMEDNSLVIIDFLLINFELNYLIPITLTFNFDNNGVSTLEKDIGIIHKNIYKGLTAFIRAGLEVFFFILIVLYFIFLIMYLKDKVNYKYEKLKGRIIRRKKKKYAQKGECFLDVRLTDYQIRKIEKKMGTKFVHLLKLLLKEKVIVVQFLNLIFSFICIILWCLFVRDLLTNMEEINTFFAEWIYDLPLATQNDIHLASLSFENYRGLLSINFLMLFIKIISLMGTYFKSTNIFLNTLMQAFADLLSFFVFFITLLLAIAISSYIYFGQSITDFYNMLQSLQLSLSFSLGIINDEVYLSMRDKHPSYTLIYFFFIVLFVKFIVIKILLAIILHFFKISMDEYNKAEQVMRTNFTKQAVGHSDTVMALNYYRKVNAKIFGFFSCSCRKNNKDSIKVTRGSTRVRRTLTSEGSNKASAKSLQSPTWISRSLKREEDEKKRLLEIEEKKIAKIKDIQLFNAEYEEDLAFVLKDGYFDSERDNYVLKDIYENKYRDIFIRAIFFVMFLACYILMVSFHSLVPWHNLLHKMLYEKLNNPMLNSIQEDQQLHYIDSVDEVRNFTFFGLPSIFDKYQINNEDFDEENDEGEVIKTNQYLLLQSNAIVQNTLLVTVKKTNFNNLEYDYQDMIREESPISLFGKMPHENMTSYVVDDIEFPYRWRQSYRSIGGYTLQIDLNTLGTEDYLGENHMKEYINEYSSIVVIEFILDNLEYNFLGYVSIVFKLDYGGYKDIYYETQMLQYGSFNNYMDYIEISSEIVFLLLLVYMWMIFFKKFMSESKAYDVWYKEFVMKLNLKTQELRHYYKPELFRKYYYLLDMEKCMELAILVISAYMIILRIILYIIESELGQNVSAKAFHDKSIYHIRQLLYDTIDKQKSYQYAGAIGIFLCSVKLTIMINLGKYFSLLIRTIQDSKANNVTFITILIFIEPAFVFYSYLSFGERNALFSRLEQAIMSCLEVLFGTLDYRQFSDADETFGPIFFFLYLFIINMILLNLFVAVVYSSYTKVKMEITKSREKWSGRRVFFFCCYRKKQYILPDKKNIINNEFEFEKMVRGYKTRMNIHLKSPADEWKNFELNQITLIGQTIYKNSNILTEMKTSMTTNHMAYETSKYQNISENHLSAFQMYHLKTLLSITEQIEKDILTIERHHEYLKELRHVKKIDEKILDLKMKNDANLNRAAILEKKVVDLEADLDNLRKLNDGLQNLHLEDDRYKRGGNNTNESHN